MAHERDVAARYRKHAADARKLAIGLRHKEGREGLLQIANHYDEMAALRDALDQVDLHDLPSIQSR
jgi:hypothetical protein